MSKDNEELLRRVIQSDWDEPKETGPAQQELANHFDHRRKRLLLYTAIYVIVGLVFILAGLRLLSVATDTKAMITGGLLAAIGFYIEVLIKLWYWIVDSRLTVLREVRQLRLELAAERTGEAVDLDAPSAQPPSSFLQRTSLRTLGRIAKAAIVAIAIFGVFIVNNGYFESMARQYMQLGYVASQHDTWTLSEGPDATVETVLYLEGWPSNRKTMEIELPYPEAVLEGVYYDFTGSELEFEQTGKHSYRVQLPPPSGWTQPTKLRFEWRVPMAALPRSEGGMYRIALKPLIPAQELRVDAVLEPGAPYRGISEKSGSEYTPFRATYPEARSNMGSCGLANPANTVE